MNQVTGRKVRESPRWRQPAAFFLCHKRCQEEFSASHAAVPLRRNSYASKGLAASRADWIRTSDLLTPSQTRYQAALRPELLLFPYKTSSFCKSVINVIWQVLLAFSSLS
jgi:hypothetical protein